MEKAETKTGRGAKKVESGDGEAALTSVKLTKKPVGAKNGVDKAEKNGKEPAPAKEVVQNGSSKGAAKGANSKGGGGGDKSDGKSGKGSTAKTKQPTGAKSDDVGAAESTKPVNEDKSDEKTTARNGRKKGDGETEKAETKTAPKKTAAAKKAENGSKKEAAAVVDDGETENGDDNAEETPADEPVKSSKVTEETEPKESKKKVKGNKKKADEQVPAEVEAEDMAVDEAEPVPSKSAGKGGKAKASKAEPAKRAGAKVKLPKGDADEVAPKRMLRSNAPKK